MPETCFNQRTYGFLMNIVYPSLDTKPDVPGFKEGGQAQGSLLTYTLPTPENLATLIARLHALMGESRGGAPKLIDTHDERAVSACDRTIVVEDGSTDGPLARLRE